jgi:hypothetical protein
LQESIPVRVRGSAVKARESRALQTLRDLGGQPAGAPRLQTAFSLLEVMIACGIFFMAIFAILALVSSVLRNARSLRVVDVDAGMVASQLYKTNKLYEGTESGDFGKIAQDYSWDTEILQAETNGLFQVNIVVHRRGLQRPVDVMSVFIWAPDSPQTGGFGQPRFR